MTTAYIVEKQEWDALNGKLDKALDLLSKLTVEAETPKQITYPEIATEYGISYGAISKKVNEAKVEQHKSRFGGRVLKSISIHDAEMLFRRKKK